MDQRPKCKGRHYKTLRGKHRQNTLWHKSQQYLFWSDQGQVVAILYNLGQVIPSRVMKNKNKNKQMGPN